MLASYEWLKELSGVDIAPEEVATRLTSLGLEVEGIERLGEDLDHVVVAEVRGLRPHPNAEKLRLVTVFDGEQEIEIVCGAPNVPEPGGRIVFAKLGACLPGGFKIKKAKIRGIESTGMICSESELGIGEGGEGIIVLGAGLADDAQPGTPVADALGLRDVIFEIGLTPNRPDGLGHIGLARELALASGVAFEMPEIDAPQRAALTHAAFAPGEPTFSLQEHWNDEVPGAMASGELGVKVRIEDPERCPRYGAALVLGAAVAPSPFWLRYRLKNLGVRPISNLVDATNLVMLEWGHPIHGFDLEKVRGREIVVRRAAAGETMKTLDDLERTFTDDDLLICDGEGPVAVAGVLGGGAGEIGDATAPVLIECAYFAPRSVRRTSRRLGLHTDASHRFERGVDPNDVRHVLARAAQLLADLSGGTAVLEGCDQYPAPIAKAEITLRAGRIEGLLGGDIPDDVVDRVLRGIGCEVTEGEGGARLIKAPTHRPDLTREADLIEEVARVHGYDHIPTRMPKVRPSEGGTPAHIPFRRQLVGAAASAGLNEAVNLAFLSPADLVNARVETNAVPLQNPLSEERSVMRTSLLPGLLANASLAERHQADSVALFEVGRTFHPSEGDLPSEGEAFAFLLTGRAPAFVGEERSYDFYDAKGALEAIGRALFGVAPVLSALGDDAPGALHPRRAAKVAIDGRDVGFVGEVHPDVVDAHGLNARPQVALLDLTELAALAATRNDPQAVQPPRFPAVTRDVALQLDETIESGAVAAALLEGAGKLGESVSLFDVYQGEHVPDGQKSLAFRVQYRDPKATLTDKKVDKAHKKAIDAAVKATGATVR